MLTLDEMRLFILEKTKQNAENFGDRMPTATDGGAYKFADDGFWVGGFWTGLNTICFQWTGDLDYLQAARASQHRLIKRLYESPHTLDHDTGFLYHLSFVADYVATGSQEARKIALDAAALLAQRYNSKGKFIQSWNVWKPGDAFSENNRGRIIVDSMYNLPLLFWAAKETGNEQWKWIAEDHADVCAATLVRPDYTTFHTYVFDPESGEPKFGQTHQGYADGSCWSRGQSWAIGGYAHAYRYTGNQAYLDMAKRLTDLFLQSLESDLVPMWDFSLPSKEGQPRDASAAAIAAAGILEIARHAADSERVYYKREATRILGSLYSHYSTRNMPDQQGLIIHACGNKPKDADVDGSLIYGDFYFAEAVSRLSGDVGVYW
jgi:unsaturated chondroitin disaccharide hydrolase